MSSLVQYNASRALLQPGDAVIVYGTDPLDKTIEEFQALTGLKIPGPSHCLIVSKALTVESDVISAESTILDGVDGVQSHPLGVRLASYGVGASADALRLSPDARSRFDLKKFYAFLGAAEGHVRYDVANLFEFVARAIPGIGPHIFQGENPGAMVCSAFLAAAYIAAGALPLTLNWAQQKPIDVLASFHGPAMWGAWVPLLGLGDPIGF